MLEKHAEIMQTFPGECVDVRLVDFKLRERRQSF